MHFVFEYIICEVGLGAYVYLSPDSTLPVYVKAQITFLQDSTKEQKTYMNYMSWYAWTPL